MQDIYKVSAQINNGDPCPKKEWRAWSWENGTFGNLSDAIEFLLDHNASGFTIEKNGEVIAEYLATHY